MKTVVTFKYLFALSVLATTTMAGVITSSEFSIGYGYTGHAIHDRWGTTETESVNVQAAPESSFILETSVEGGGLSPLGPDFKRRALGALAQGEYTGVASNFLANLRAIYAGPKPSDAADEPNYRTSLAIRKINIYAAPIKANTSQALAFRETTPQNEQVQKPAVLPNSGDFRNASNWKKIEWTPGGFFSPGTSQRRTFSLSEGPMNDIKNLIYVVDGFEIVGQIVVEYDSVAEQDRVGSDKL